MKLHSLVSISNRKKLRVGRGESSGHGKTSGRGNKGARARSGYRVSPVTSGIPWYRKLPMRGFSNFNFGNSVVAVTIRQLNGLHAKGIAEITPEVLKRLKIIRGVGHSLKIIGNGKLLGKMQVRANSFSKGALAAISDAGGTAVSIGNVGAPEVEIQAN